jgi:hypothetical protein
MLATPIQTNLTIQSGSCLHASNCSANLYLGVYPLESWLTRKMRRPKAEPSAGFLVCLVFHVRRQFFDL